MKKNLLFSFLFLFLAWSVNAHTSGFTYEVNTNGYFVDIGSSKSIFIPGELSLFEFNLYPVNNSNELADFDHVFVTVSDQSNGVVYSGSIYRPEGSLTVMSYAFLNSGEYKISARFGKGSDKLAEVEFPVSVAGKRDYSAAAKIAGISFIIGLGIFWLIKRKVNS